MPLAKLDKGGQSTKQGTNDEIFPIEDSMIPLQHGSVKEARYVFSLSQCTMSECSDRPLQVYTERNAHGGTSRGPHHSQMDRRAFWY